MRWTKEKLEKLKKMYPDKSWDTLEREFGCSRRRIRQVVNRYKIWSPRKLKARQTNKFKEYNLTEKQLSYLAGLIDGEGTLIITTDSTKYGKVFRPEILISNSKLNYLKIIHSWLNCGWMRGLHAKRKRAYAICIYGVFAVLNLIKKLEQFLILKKPQAKNMIDYCNWRLEQPTEKFDRKKAEEFVIKSKKLNKIYGCGGGGKGHSDSG